MTPEQWNDLKREEERLKQAAANAEGALTQLLKQLQAEFGCSTHEAGVKLERQLQREEEEARKAAEEALVAYQCEFES
mgnify:CR=1 FL=1